MGERFSQKYSSQKYILINYIDYIPIIDGDFNKFNIEPLLQHLYVKNVINLPTRKQNVLNLALIGSDVSVHYSTAFSFPPLQSLTSVSDHNVMLVKGSISLKRNLVELEVYDLRLSNIARFVNKCANINWSPLFNSYENVDTKCLIFYDLLGSAITAIPVDHVVIDLNSSDSFVSTVCLSIANKRDKAFAEGNSVLYNHYKDKYNREIINSKKLWARNIRTKSNFWQIVKSINGKPNSNSAICGLLNKFSNLKSFVDEISESYASVFLPKEQSKINDFLSEIQSNTDITDNLKTWNCGITVNMVKKALNDLNINKSTGSDGLSAKLLSSASVYLAEPVTHIFCASIEERRFPDYWKHATVIPIPKKSTCTTVNDLRPISLTPILSKMLERIILNLNINLFTNNYGNNQYAYRSESSTTAAVVRLHNDITEQLDYTDTLYKKKREGRSYRQPEKG